jgi:endoribonuclease Dicer
VPQPTYIIRANGLGQFVCELVLPASSAVTPVEGPPMKTKATAKRAAAFEVCMRLRKENLLNEYLLPKYRIKELPKFANARLAVDLNKTNTYNFRRKPSFWDVKDDEPPTELWITIITLTDPEEMRTRPSLRPICIATRHMLPDIPVFPIFGTDGGRSNVILRKVVSPLKTDQEVIRLLDVFTDRVFYDVFNKHFEFTYNTTHYWIAPVNSGAFDENSLAMEILNWELLRHVGSNREVIWNPEYPIENLVDRFLVDRVDRSRRFIVLDIVHRLTPKDRVPETVAKGAGFENILDYSYNAGKKRRWQQVKWEIPETEPVFLANRVLHRLNFLENPREKEHSTVTEAVICPSPFHISMVSLPVTRLLCYANWTRFLPHMFTR